MHFNQTVVIATIFFSFESAQKSDRRANEWMNGKWESEELEKMFQFKF